MRSIATAFLLLASCALPLRAQTDPPELSAWLLNTASLTGYQGLPANVQSVRYSAGSVYVGSSGIPSYTIGPWPGNPNVPANQSYVFRIPRTPSVNAGTKTATSLGPIGVWRNGVPVFNAKDAMSYNNQNVWHQNAVVVEGPSFDACLGHPAPGGVYHHHQNPRCLYDRDTTSHAPLLGYAFDGYPIYGPDGFANPDGSGGIVRLRSSYRFRSITQRRTLPDGTVLSPAQYGPDVSGSFPLGYYIEDYEYAAGSGDLDAYNGRFAVTPEYPQGTYAYVATVNANGSSAYPYAVGPRYYGVVATDNITQQGHVTITEAVRSYVPFTAAPALAAPAQDTVIQTLAVTVTWHPLAGSSSYRLQCGADPSFATTELDTTVAETSFAYVPSMTGTYHVRVLGLDGEASSPWSVSRGFSYVRPGATRWAIVSLPRIVADARASVLFPTASSAAYGYSPGSGYASADTLRVGRGYWMKVPPGSLAAGIGDPVSAESVAVTPGWNLIGAPSATVQVAAIASDPPGMTTSAFFSYDGMYAVADSLVPGHGYWVSVTEPGTLLIPGGAAASAAIRVVPGGQRPPEPPGEAPASTLPRAPRLHQNYPNPFNPSTTMRFESTGESSVEIRVYDLLGSLVATLVDGVWPAGVHTVTWDGRNDRGGMANSGVYVCRYRSGDVTESRKMALVR